VKNATKRELIVVATMISRMIGTSVFSDRTRFSVSTAQNKPKLEVEIEEELAVNC
jgi:hypothetical protein